MKDHIAKQAYDRGYDAGAADKAKTAATPGQNPYKPVRTVRMYSRYELWDMGYDDGFVGRTRKMSRAEADERKAERMARLEEIARAVARMEGVICTCGAEHGTECLVMKARAAMGDALAVAA